MIADLELAYFVVPRTRQRIKLPVALAREHSLPRSTDQTDLAGPEPHADGCGGCTSAHLIRLEWWAGVIWYGVPFPKRIRVCRKFPFLLILEFEGCGCIKILRDLYLSLREAWRITWRRHQVAREVPMRREAARKAALRYGQFRIPAMGGGYVDAAGG